LQADRFFADRTDNKIRSPKSERNPKSEPGALAVNEEAELFQSLSLNQGRPKTSKPRTLAEYAAREASQLGSWVSRPNGADLAAAQGTALGFASKQDSKP
jgi:hypothetical protein